MRRNFVFPAENGLVEALKSTRADLLANTGKSSLKSAPGAFISHPGFATITMHRLACGLRKSGFRTLAKLVWRRNTARSGCHLHMEATIGPGLMLPHPTAIVIGIGTQIGAGVTIYQGVTLGRARREDRYPVIKDGVTIYPNAVVVGGITVGRDAVIGAGSIALADVPAGAVVAGNPAAIVRGATHQY